MPIFALKPKGNCAAGLLECKWWKKLGTQARNPEECHKRRLAQRKVLEHEKKKIRIQSLFFDNSYMKPITTCHCFVCHCFLM